MKKLIVPVMITAIAAFVFTTSSCDNKVCIKCTKIGDPTDIQEYCSTDQYNRNDFIVEQTHDDYNCAEVEE